ncbi:uncharacterized protein KY384_006158 [Bacidia gigantensis]|uniref:uncharacterized protein n=1 Tax=Bacidia gigantensis TaxID=2732470 RepID=UPI001D059070|nr:uncharacterized protein KY384_006158 [Bacidia gigantensis]KAG8529521.1 hypothetical protein KY384_006158 [Bacidia gigantensis]
MAVSSQEASRKRRRVSEADDQSKLDVKAEDSSVSDEEDVSSALGPIVDLFKHAIMTVADVRDVQTRQERVEQQQEDIKHSATQLKLWEAELALNTMRKQHNALSAAHADIESRHEHLRLEHEMLEQAFTDQKCVDSDQTLTLKKELEFKIVENTSLQQQLDHSRHDARGSDSQHRAQLDYLKRQITAQDNQGTENDDLKEQLRAKEAERQEQVRAKEAECQELRVHVRRILNLERSASNNQQAPLDSQQASLNLQHSGELQRALGEISHHLRNARAHNENVESFNRSCAKDMEGLFQTLYPLVNSAVRESFEKIKATTKDMKSSIRASRRSSEEAERRATKAAKAEVDLQMYSANNPMASTPAPSSTRPSICNNVDMHRDPRRHSLTGPLPKVSFRISSIHVPNEHHANTGQRDDMESEEGEGIDLNEADVGRTTKEYAQECHSKADTKSKIPNTKRPGYNVFENNKSERRRKTVDHNSWKEDDRTQLDRYSSPRKESDRKQEDHCSPLVKRAFVYCRQPSATQKKTEA